MIVHMLRFLSLFLLLLAVASQSAGRAQEAASDLLLASANFSSPSAVLTTFLSSTTEANRLTLEAYRQRRTEGGLFASAEVTQKVKEAEILLERAARALDTSHLPPAVVAHAKLERVLMLKEILDRVALPDAADIPDAAAVQAADAAGRPLTRWRIPGIDLAIVEVMEGPRAGDFVLSGDSVDRIDEIYEAVLPLPSRVTGEDVYEFYSQSPGRLLPPFWYEYIRNGPSQLNVTIGNQAMWQWMALLLFTVFAASAMMLLLRSHWRRPMPADPSLAVLRQAILPIALIAIATLFLAASNELINLTGYAYRFSEVAGRILRTLGMAWLAVLACNIVAELVIKSPSIRSNSLDAHLLRAAFRVLGLALGVILLSRTATALGMPLLGVLAGLGVGGLALALAAQPTIENFIGGVILYADRPVRIGDFCRCGDVMGTVEEIGIRSTRVRALDRTLVSIPNAEFAKSRIVNFTRRDYHLFETTIGVRLETTPVDIERLLERLRTTLEAHPLVMRETMRVRFSGVGESSLNIDFWMHILTKDYGQFLMEKENLLLSIIGQVVESGCTLAFPSRTVYLSQDQTRQGQSGATDGEGIDATAAIGVPGGV